MKIHQLSLFLENKPGHLVEPCRLLADAGINIRTLSVADTQQFGILRMIVSDWQKATAILKDAGCVVNVTEVLAVEVPDRPGGLAERAGTLREQRRQHRVHVRLHLRAAGQGGADLPLRQAR